MSNGSGRARHHEEIDQIVSEVLSAVAKLSTTVQHHDVALTRIETSLDTMNDRLGNIGKTDWKLVTTGFFGTCSLLVTLGVMSLGPVQKQLDKLSEDFQEHRDAEKEFQKYSLAKHSGAEVEAEWIKRELRDARDERHEVEEIAREGKK